MSSQRKKKRARHSSDSSSRALKGKASPNADADSVTVDEKAIRGYFCKFKWNHYPKDAGKDAPKETDLVPSIPTLFYRMLQTLQQVNQSHGGAGILAQLDKRIVKPAAMDSKLSLKAPDGTVYAVNACRKEHLRLIYENTEKGLLSTLGLCPHLIDVYFVMGGQDLVGGAALDGLACTCGAGPPESKTDVQVARDNGAETTQEQQSSTDKSEEVAQEDRDSPRPVKRARTSKAKLKMEEAEEDAIVNTNLPDDMELINTPSLDDIWDNIDQYIKAAKKSVNRIWVQRVRDQNVLIDTLQDELEKSKADVELWQQRYLDEKANNKRLWAKMAEVEKAVARLRRPIKDVA